MTISTPYDAGKPAVPTEHDTSTPAGLLEAVADHIERVGLNQNGGFFAIPQQGRLHLYLQNTPCCVIGAMKVVTGDATRTIAGLKEDVPGAEAAVVALQDHLRQATRSYWDVAHWSDVTPESEVLATLRRVADDLRERGQ